MLALKLHQVLAGNVIKQRITKELYAKVYRGNNEFFTEIFDSYERLIRPDMTGQNEILNGF